MKTETSLKLRNFLIAALLSVFAISTFAKAGLRIAGGGGRIEELRAQDALSKEDMNELLKNNAYLLKSEVLIKVPTYWRSGKDISNPKAAFIYDKMTSNKIPLVNDFWQSLYQQTDKSDCKCEDNKDMCTGNYFFAPICVNVDALATKLTSYSEFIGLVIHEHSHHFVGEQDHQLGLSLAKFFENSVKNNLLLGKTFTYANGDLTYSENGKSYKYWPSYSPHWKNNANLICIMKGYSESLSFTIEPDFDLTTFEIVTFIDGRLIVPDRNTTFKKLRPSLAKFFTEIVCK